MSTLNTTIVHAFNAADSEAKAIEAVRKAAGRMSRDKFEAVAQQVASTHYAVPLITKSTGRVVFDSNAPKYETARKRVQRLVKALFETSPSDEIEVPAELLKAAAVLAKLASEYEGSRSLASKALAAAFSK